MKPVHFLAELYLGPMDPSPLQLPSGALDSSKIRPVVSRYRQLVKEYPPATMETLGTIPPEVLQRMADIGLFGLSIDAAYGGLGLTTLEYLKVVEEIARIDLSVAMVSLAHLSIGVKGIVLFGSEAQKQKYLPPAASGQMIFAYALTEPATGSDARHISTRARLAEDGQHYVLSGQKTYITNANYAGAMTVFAQLEGHPPGFMGAFMVETSWDGVMIGQDMPKMGLRVSSTAAVQLDHVAVPLANLLGQPGDGFKIAMTILNYGRLGLGAASVGLMEQSLEDMKRRSSDRIQFGVPIKSFPLIQEKLVRAKVYCSAANAMNNLTAALLDEHPLADLAIETSHCKLFGTTRAWEVLYDALQVAGGSGYLSTQPYEKRMRDFRVATVFEGTTEIHSIYPPLFLLRLLTKRLHGAVRGLGRGLPALLKGLLRNTRWVLDLDAKPLQDAARLAAAIATRVKRMLLGGFLKYRRTMTEQEFLLRRITTLSLYCYALLALVTHLHHKRLAGRLEQEDLHLLEYFREEAKEALRHNRHIGGTHQEALHARVCADLWEPRQ
jgi:acyl-CoA dehydrogenase family member 9